MPDECGLLRGHNALRCECLREFCLFCHGRLLSCTVCGALGTVWPDDCPGRPLSLSEVTEIYFGRLNYRDGAWQGEPTEVMHAMRTRYKGAGEDDERR